MINSIIVPGEFILFSKISDGNPERDGIDAPLMKYFIGVFALAGKPPVIMTWDKANFKFRDRRGFPVEPFAYMYCPDPKPVGMDYARPTRKPTREEMIRWM